MGGSVGWVVLFLIWAQVLVSGLWDRTQSLPPHTLPPPHTDTDTYTPYTHCTTILWKLLLKPTWLFKSPCLICSYHLLSLTSYFWEGELLMFPMSLFPFFSWITKLPFSPGTHTNFWDELPPLFCSFLYTNKCFHVTFFMYSTTTWLFSTTLPRNSTIRLPVTCQVDMLWPFYCLTSLKTCTPDHVTSSLSPTAFQDSLMVHHFWGAFLNTEIN